MSPATHANRLARGTRFGVIDVVLLGFPVTAIVALLTPLLLSAFYYGPMEKQPGVFTVAECARTSTDADEAGFVCAGTFVPDDGSAPITREPHVFDDIGKILEPGDEFALTLYESDLMLEPGDAPVLYQIGWLVGGSFGVVGLPVLITYFSRWRRSGGDRGAEVEQTSALTGLPIQENGWDAEPPVARKSRMTLIGVMLVVFAVGSVVGFGSAIGAQWHRNGVAHAAGVMTVDSCWSGSGLDSDRTVSVGCVGTFLADTGEADNLDVMPDVVVLNPWFRKEYEPGERVPIEVYEDGTVKDHFGPDPSATPGIAVGVAFGFGALVAGGVWWLSLAAGRPARIRH